MSSFKPLIILVVLGGVGFGVYRSLNKGPAEPPPGTDLSVTAAPEIKLGDATVLAARDRGANGAPPNLLQPAPGGEAPPFDAAASRNSAPRNPASEVAPPFASATNRGPVAESAPPPYAGVPDDRAGQAYAPQSASNSADSLTAGSGAPADAAGDVAGSRTAPGRSESLAAVWGAIQPKLAAGQLSEALEDLTAWRNHPSLTPAEHETVENLLSQLAGTVIYSREHLLAAPYRAQPGERLADIAEKYKVTTELLAKINQLEPAAPLQPGQEVKVVPGPFSAIVDVGADRLTLMLGSRYAGSFPLADLGSAVETRVQSGTPVEFAITQKTTAPIYNSPQGEIEAGDAANPLGQHLLALGGELAIHGTNPQASPQVEQPSAGIRMNAADLVDVYDILTVGSRVIVRK